MIRRRDGSGEKEFRGADEAIWLRMWLREGGWKMEGSRRSVKRRVFEGMAGREREGTLEVSMERLGREEWEEDREARLALNE